jgi:hypothetical protein
MKNMLDVSALPAWLQDEPAAEIVEDWTVNKPPGFMILQTNIGGVAPSHTADVCFTLPSAKLAGRAIRAALRRCGGV